MAILTWCLVQSSVVLANVSSNTTRASANASHDNDDNDDDDDDDAMDNSKGSQRPVDVDPEGKVPRLGMGPGSMRPLGLGSTPGTGCLGYLCRRRACSLDFNLLDETRAVEEAVVPVYSDCQVHPCLWMACAPPLLTLLAARACSTSSSSVLPRFTTKASLICSSLALVASTKS